MPPGFKLRLHQCRAAKSPAMDVGKESLKGSETFNTALPFARFLKVQQLIRQSKEMMDVSVWSPSNGRAGSQPLVIPWVQSIILGAFNGANSCCLHDKLLSFCVAACLVLLPPVISSTQDCSISCINCSLLMDWETSRENPAACELCSWPCSGVPHGPCSAAWQMCPRFWMWC